MLLAVFCLGLTSVVHSEDDHPVSIQSPLAVGEGVAPGADLIDYQVFGVPGQAGVTPTMSEERESGRFVVAKSDSDTWAVNERVNYLNLGEALPIPLTSTVVPTDLWSIDTGAGYLHRFDNGRDLGLNFGVGSDSDKPFYSMHEMVFRASASYRVPSGETNAWLFLLNYSNNRHFLNNVPLPGVAYYFQADENRLQGLIGFPFAALRYRPTPDWSLQASIFGPRNLNAEIARRIIGPVRLFTAFQWGSQEWLLADRADYSNRLFFDRKRASLGLRSPLGHGLLLEVSGGRQFDQRFFVNDSSSYSEVPTLGLAPAWFMEAKLSYRFGPAVDHANEMGPMDMMGRQ